MEIEIEVLEENFRRNIEIAKKLVEKIWKLSREIGETIKIMDFCGTHEWTITRFGIRSLIPENIELVAGPGCPVCVTPSHYIEQSIKLALEGITIYTYGDMYKLKTIESIQGISSLSEVKALGGKIKVVTSILDAIKDSRKTGKPSVFIAVGFETAASGYAKTILNNMIPENMKILSITKLTPPAMQYTIEITREKPTEPPIMGVIAPGHVSTITGAKTWTIISENHKIPIVVSGFEPIDVLASITEILKQIRNREAKTVIEYKRAVTWHGNLQAQWEIHKTFEIVDDAWRGIGFLPKSKLKIRREYEKIDAEIEYGIPELNPENWKIDLPPNCKCAEIVMGKAKPTQCPHFKKTCNLDKPIGPCMISIEGTCSIWAKYGEGKIAKESIINIWK